MFKMSKKILKYGERCDSSDDECCDDGPIYVTVPNRETMDLWSEPVSGLSTSFYLGSGESLVYDQVAKVLGKNSFISSFSVRTGNLMPLSNIVTFSLVTRTDPSVGTDTVLGSITLAGGGFFGSAAVNQTVTAGSTITIRVDGSNGVNFDSISAQVFFTIN